MGLDELHGIAFVHIPKCGGTTVTDQLKVLTHWKCDEGLVQHPELGLIASAHIPLYFLKAHYSPEFAKLTRYESFALVRDPHERFASAVFERLSWYGGVNRLRVTVPQAMKEARRVIEWLRQNERFCDAEYIHFCRQIDFIMLDGVRIVKNIYRLEDMAAFGRHLRRLGVIEFDDTKKLNANYTSRYGILFSIGHRFGPLYRTLTTSAFRRKLLNLLMRINRSGPQSVYERFRGNPEISKFVERYYSADFAIWQTTKVDATTTVSPDALGDGTPAQAQGVTS